MKPQTKSEPKPKLQSQRATLPPAALDPFGTTQHVDPPLLGRPWPEDEPTLVGLDFDNAADR